MKPVADLIDRSILVPRSKYICTAWITVSTCTLGNHAPMSPEAVEKAYRRLLSQGDAASWPPPNGEWLGDRFVIHDGRHEYIASLMLGRTEILVAWMADDRKC